LACAVVAGVDVDVAGAVEAGALALVVGAGAPPHPAKPSTSNDNIAANLIFIVFLHVMLIDGVKQNPQKALQRGAESIHACIGRCQRTRGYYID
jgi:hypothetical protein